MGRHSAGTGAATEGTPGDAGSSALPMTTDTAATGAADPAGDPEAPGAPAPAAPAAPRQHGSFLKELPFLILVAFVLALLIKAFFIQAFYIPSGSMENTLQVQDRVLVNKLVYRFRDVHRGEIVVFDGRGSFQPEFSAAPEPTDPLRRALRGLGRALGVAPPDEKDFIKRVIGLPGDTVACCTNGHVTVQPAGAPAAYELDEDYLFEDDRKPFGPITVPEGRLWVLGDHRGASSDSRFHVDDANQGTIPIDRVIGRAFVVVWPPGNAKVLRVPDTFDRPPTGAQASLEVATVETAPYALGLVGALPVTALRRRVRRRRATSAAA